MVSPDSGRSASSDVPSTRLQSALQQQGSLTTTGYHKQCIYPMQLRRESSQWNGYLRIPQYQNIPAGPASSSDQQVPARKPRRPANTAAISANLSSSVWTSDDRVPSIPLCYVTNCACCNDFARDSSRAMSPALLKHGSIIPSIHVAYVAKIESVIDGPGRKPMTASAHSLPGIK